MASRSITHSHTLAYGIAEYGKGMLIATMQFVWLYFLTDVLSIPPAIAGAIMLIPIVWDGIADPIIGYIADGTHTRWGKYRPYLYFATPVTAVAFVLCFVKPPFALGGTIVFAGLVSLLYRTSYAAVDVPENALMALATPNSKERASLAAAKVVVGGIGALTVSMAVVPILNGATLNNEAQRFFIAAIVGALVAVVTLYWCAHAFRDVDCDNSVGVRLPRPSLKEFFGVLADNSPLYIVFGVWVVSMMTLPTFSKSIIYFAKYQLGDPAWAGVALGVMNVGQILAALAWGWLAHYFDKARLAQAGQVISILVLTTLFFTTSTNRLFLGSLFFLEGASIGGTFSVAMSMVPDLVEFAEWKKGRRVEAGIFGYFTFAVKVGQGIGIGVFGILLGQVGFVANTIQTPGVLHSMRLLMTVLPIAGAVFALVILGFYRLSHDNHRKIREMLEIRRAEMIALSEIGAEIP